MDRKTKHLILHRLKVKLGDPVIHPTRPWIEFNCPFCGDKKHNHGVNLEAGRTHCFRCKYKSSLREFVREVLGQALEDALFSKAEGHSWAARIATGKGTYLGREDGRDLTLEDRLQNLHRFMASTFTPLPSPGSVIGEKAVEYALSRGVDPRRWEVGLSTREAYVGRLMFVFREKGRPVFMQGRKFTPGGSNVKSLSLPPGVGMDRNSVVPNIDLMGPESRVVITEGPFDMVATTNYAKKFIGTCAMGSELGLPFITKLKKKGVRRVYVFGDFDYAGEKFVAATSLMMAREGMTVFPVLLKNNRQHKEADPSTIGAEACLDVLERTEMMSATEADRFEDFLFSNSPANINKRVTRLSSHLRPEKRRRSRPSGRRSSLRRG